MKNFLRSLYKMPDGKQKGYRFGRFLVTWCWQAQGAPFIDPATSTDDRKITYRGYAVLLTRGAKTNTAKALSNRLWS